jgi:hypothetical protein
MCELEAEVGRLKHLVAELALDRRMLQEALKKTTARKRARTSAFLDNVAPGRPGVSGGSSGSEPSS